MNGLSAKPWLLLPAAKRVSSTVAQTVPELPAEVAQFTQKEYSKAARALIFDEFGKVVDCPENTETLSAIKAALTSSDCDPGIKRSIFENLSNLKRNSTHSYSEDLNVIFESIRSDGDQINLDNVDFSSIHFELLDLSEASMIGAKFDTCSLLCVDLADADLTGAVFNDSEIALGNMTGVKLIGSVLEKTSFKNVDMVRADLTGVAFVSVEFGCIAAGGMMTDDPLLQKILEKSSFDTEQMCDNVSVDAFIRLRFMYRPKPESHFITILNGRYSSNGKHTMYMPSSTQNQFPEAPPDATKNLLQGRD